MRLYKLEGEERDAALNAFVEVTAALGVKLPVQGDLFAGALSDDGDPEFAEPGDAYVDTVGPDTAKAARTAARNGHRYPRSKFAGGGVGGEVLTSVFGNGDAA